MLGLLKKYFVPHPENGHVPHLLRVETVLAMLAAVLVAEVLFIVHIIALGQSGMLATIIANVLIDRTNEERLAEGIPALTANPLLARAAQMKAEDMAKRGYFAHTSPAGVTPWHWFGEAGYRYLRAGENLAVNFVDSEDVIRAWMDSPKHRENIENGKYTEIGIGTATGTYRGKETVFIVQLFGLPSPPETVGSQNIAPTFRPVAILNEAGEPEILPAAADVAGAAAGGADAALSTESAVVLSGIAEIETQLPPARTSETKRYAKLLDRIASSPRAVTQMFYITLATLVALALMLVFFLHSPVPRPHIVKHSVLFLVIIGAMVLANYYVTLASAQIF